MTLGLPSQNGVAKASVIDRGSCEIYTRLVKWKWIFVILWGPAWMWVPKNQYLLGANTLVAWQCHAERPTEIRRKPRWTSDVPIEKGCFIAHWKPCSWLKKPKAIYHILCTRNQQTFLEDSNAGAIMNKIEQCKKWGTKKEEIVTSHRKLLR